MEQSGVEGAGWKTDPEGRFDKRWFDGYEWTEHVTTESGTPAIDPFVPNEVRTPEATPAPTASLPLPPPPPPAHQYPPPAAPAPGVQTPNFNLPGGGAWAAPQQIVVTNASKSPGMAITSLVLGVGAFFFSLIPLFGWLSIPFAIIGLALGIAGIFRANKGFEGRGLSIAGVVASVAALFVSIVWFVVVGNAVKDEVDNPRWERRDGICDFNRPFTDPDC